jgi:hypothetical protein
VREIEGRALKQLRMIRGIDAELVEGHLQVAAMGAAPVRFELQSKARLSEGDLERLLPRLRSHQAILATRRLSPRRREQLSAADVSWIEYDSGFVHLRAPGLVVDRPEDPGGSRPDDAAPALPSLNGKAGVVVEVLIELAEQERSVKQSEVAHLSGSDQAWVSRIFAALVAAGALEELGSGPGKEWKPLVDELLDLWVRDGGPGPQVTTFYAWVRSPHELVRNLAGLDPVVLPYAVGGVTAANLHAPTLSEAPTPEVWLPAAIPPRRLAEALGGELVESGANARVWQADGDPALRRARALSSWRDLARGELSALRVVSPPRAVVEASRGRGRAQEVADRLRDDLISTWGRRDG